MELEKKRCGQSRNYVGKKLSRHENNRNESMQEKQQGTVLENI